MLWVIFLINDKEPLMFINTVTSVKDSFNQKEFDSRKSNNKIVEEVMTVLSEKEIKKLRSIVELYNRNQMVYCKVVVDDMEYLGIPIMLKNKILTVKTSDSVLCDIDINKIKSVEIVHF